MVHSMRNSLSSLFRRCSSWTSFDTPVMRVFFDQVVDVPVVLCNGIPQVQFIGGFDVPMIMRGQRSALHLAVWLRTRLGVQIVPASGSSSELRSHHMAIRSHPGVHKMPASGISSELSAHQMAPAGSHQWARKRGTSLREWGASLLGSRSCLIVSCAYRFLCSSR